MKSKKQISVVLPVFNENANLMPLFARLEKTLRPLGEFEIIFVDDGSRDNSYEVLSRLFHLHPENTQVVRHARNFGQHVALLTGLEMASGQTVIFMDCDLQQSPEELPLFIGKVNEGFDCVIGVRGPQKGSFFKRLSSTLFWMGISRLSNTRIVPHQVMTRAFNQSFAKALLSMGDVEPFLAGMCAWVGMRQTTLTVEHEVRAAGKTSYSLGRMIRLMWTASTGYSMFPLKMATALGLLSATGSFLLGLYFMYQKAVNGLGITGWASLMVSVFFASGVQLIVLGVMGEYIGRTFWQTLNRPRKIVDQHLGGDQATLLSFIPSTKTAS